MDWPSENVARGGVFQPAKVNYSPETRDFLKALIQESNMTIMQRNKINYSLRSGEPLPALSNFQSQHRKKRNKVVIRPGTSRRRSFSTILKSGAYERDKNIPFIPKVDREKIKEELAEKMANGKVCNPKIKEKPKPKKEEPFLNRYEQIKQEIQEREEWLEEMEALGEGEKHRLIIHLQIQERLREMEKLKLTDE